MTAMRKFLIAFASLALLFVTPVALAAEKKPEIIKLGSDQTIKKDYFAFAEKVEISGTVNGDVYAAAATVVIDGKINGDLLVAGGNVSITGEVTQDVRLGAGNTTISGKIGRNLTAGGGNIEVTPGAIIGGSVLVGAGNINLNGSVGRDIKVGAGSLRINNTISGDVEASVGSLTLASKATVAGKVTYWSENEASIDTAAKVSGAVVRSDPPEEARFLPLRIMGILEGVATLLRIISFVSTLILGLLLLKLVPKFMSQTTETLNKRPLGSLGVGLVGLILWPILAILLMIIVITAPLGLIALTLYGISLWVSKIFVINWLGSRIFTQTTKKFSPYWAFVVGTVVFYLIGWIPVVGGILTLVSLIFGLGTLLITKKTIYQAALTKNIV